MTGTVGGVESSELPSGEGLSSSVVGLLLSLVVVVPSD